MAADCQSPPSLVVFPLHPSLPFLKTKRTTLFVIAFRCPFILTKNDEGFVIIAAAVLAVSICDIIRG